MTHKKVWASLSLAALAACSSPGMSPRFSSAAVPATRNLTVATAARDVRTSNRTLYISYLESNSVAVYARDVPPATRMITTGVSSPEGIFVDAKGTLYVTNTDIPIGHFTVTEYPDGASQPSVTIATTYKPLSVVVDSKGRLYVGGITNHTIVINEYAVGGTTPIKTVFPTTIVGSPFMGGLAVDQSDNLYASFFMYDHPPSHVVKFGPNLRQEKELQLAGLDNIDLNPGLGIDASGNLYVGGTANGINVYPPGSKNPVRSLSAGFSQYFAVGADGSVYDPETVFVDEFAPGATEPTAQFEDARYPVGAAIR